MAANFPNCSPPPCPAPGALGDGRMPTLSRAPATAAAPLSVCVCAFKGGVTVRDAAFSSDCQSGRVESCPLPNMMQLIRTKRTFFVVCRGSYRSCNDRRLSAAERKSMIWSSSTVPHAHSASEPSSSAILRRRRRRRRRRRLARLVPLLVISIAFSPSAGRSRSAASRARCTNCSTPPSLAPQSTRALFTRSKQDANFQRSNIIMPCQATA